MIRVVQCPHTFNTAGIKAIYCVDSRGYSRIVYTHSPALQPRLMMVAGFSSKYASSSDNKPGPPGNNEPGASDGSSAMEEHDGGGPGATGDNAMECSGANKSEFFGNYAWGGLNRSYTPGFSLHKLSAPDLPPAPEPEPFGDGPHDIGSMPFPFPYTVDDMIVHIGDLRYTASKLEEEADYLMNRIYGTDERTPAVYEMAHVMAANVPLQNVRRDPFFWALYKRGVREGLAAYANAQTILSESNGKTDRPVITDEDVDMVYRCLENIAM